MAGLSPSERELELRSKWNVTGKRPPEGAVTGKKSVIQQTKNEPVVDRNIFQRA